MPPPLQTASQIFSSRRRVPNAMRDRPRFPCDTIAQAVFPHLRQKTGRATLVNSCSVALALLEHRSTIRGGPRWRNTRNIFSAATAAKSSISRRRRKSTRRSAPSERAEKGANYFLRENGQQDLYTTIAAKFARLAEIFRRTIFWDSEYLSQRRKGAKEEGLRKTSV